MQHTFADTLWPAHDDDDDTPYAPDRRNAGAITSGAGAVTRGDAGTRRVTIAAPGD
jgi:hypothetical protein